MSKLVVALLMGLALAIFATAVAVAAEDVKCEGTIAKIDGANLTVKAAAESHTMLTDAKTKVTLDGSAAKFSDLKVGQKVKATCTKEGTKLTCVSIEATSS
jgi:hypothetical protein